MIFIELADYSGFIVKKNQSHSKETDGGLK